MMEIMRRDPGEVTGAREVPKARKSAFIQNIMRRYDSTPDLTECHKLSINNNNNKTEQLQNNIDNDSTDSVKCPEAFAGRKSESQIHKAILSEIKNGNLSLQVAKATPGSDRKQCTLRRGRTLHARKSGETGGKVKVRVKPRMEAKGLDSTGESGSDEGEETVGGEVEKHQGEGSSGVCDSDSAASTSSPGSLHRLPTHLYERCQILSEDECSTEEPGQVDRSFSDCADLYENTSVNSSGGDGTALNAEQIDETTRMNITNKTKLMELIDKVQAGKCDITEPSKEKCETTPQRKTQSSHRQRSLKKSLRKFRGGSKDPNAVSQAWQRNYLKQMTKSLQEQLGEPTPTHGTLSKAQIAKIMKKSHGQLKEILKKPMDTLSRSKGKLSEAVNEPIHRFFSKKATNDEAPLPPPPRTGVSEHAHQTHDCDDDEGWPDDEFSDDDLLDGQDEEDDIYSAAWDSSDTRDTLEEAVRLQMSEGSLHGNGRLVVKVGDDFYDIPMERPPHRRLPVQDLWTKDISDDDDYMPPVEPAATPHRANSAIRTRPLPALPPGESPPAFNKSQTKPPVPCHNIPLSYLPTDLYPSSAQKPPPPDSAPPPPLPQRPGTARGQLPPTPRLPTPQHAGSAASPRMNPYLPPRPGQGNFNTRFTQPPPVPKPVAAHRAPSSSEEDEYEEDIYEPMDEDQSQNGSQPSNRFQPPNLAGPPKLPTSNLPRSLPPRPDQESPYPVDRSRDRPVKETGQKMIDGINTVTINSLKGLLKPVANRQAAREDTNNNTNTHAMHSAVTVNFQTNNGETNNINFEHNSGGNVKARASELKKLFEQGPSAGKGPTTRTSPTPSRKWSAESQTNHRPPPPLPSAHQVPKQSPPQLPGQRKISQTIPPQLPPDVRKLSNTERPRKPSFSSDSEGSGSGQFGVNVASGRKVSQGSRVNRPLPPVSHVEELETLYSYPWYFGEIERCNIKRVLERHNKDGAFLIRKGSKTPYAISLFSEGKVYNMIIRQRDDLKFAIGTERSQEQTFVNIPELVSYHSQFPLFVSGKGTDGSQVLLTNSPPKT